jgi:pimeloyl-ACP methyl ester carboxylesterase
LDTSKLASEVPQPEGEQVGITRRSWLTGLCALGWAGTTKFRIPPRPGTFSSKAAVHVPADLKLLDWKFPGSKPWENRAVILVPSQLSPKERVPVLVMMHGFKEATINAEAGAYAWLNKYDVGKSYARLRHAPVASTQARHDLTAQRALELNRILKSKPFKKMVLVCPYTPNVWFYHDHSKALDIYADFLDKTLFPRIAKEIPQADIRPAHVGIDGCSFGGYVAIETFLRIPQRFGVLGLVQGALSQGSMGVRKLTDYADAVQKARKNHHLKRVHILTSNHDKYLKISKEFEQALIQRKVPADFLESRGNHDSTFLKDVGGLEMLLWHHANLS